MSGGTVFVVEGDVVKSGVEREGMVNPGVKGCREDDMSGPNSVAGDVSNDIKLPEGAGPVKHLLHVTWQNPRGKHGAGSVMKAALHLPKAFCTMQPLSFHV